MIHIETKMASKPDEQDRKKTWKAEELKEIEHQVQKSWEMRKIFNRDADLKNPDTFMATFPYPYMNGFLHLGHGFTMSKYDFASRFYQSMGYDVLEPFSFHLTGMPIMAAADKLKVDLQKISQGVAPRYLPETSQYRIMLNMGICESEIKEFTDPKYWGKYFPEIAKKTLQRFGIGYDPRRSFITTDANPFYDRFVKWQFLNLYKKNALKFGTRYDLYSIKDAQPCLGHDRSSGEEAAPQKQYLIQFELKECVTKRFKTVGDMNQGVPVYLVAMMLRPETLSGATNLWVDKNGTYKLLFVETSTSSANYWICQESNLVNLTFQNRPSDLFHIERYVDCGTIHGSELVGETVTHPFVKTRIPYVSQDLTVCPLNYQSVEPTLKIDMTKGTGIAVSVPSDSPIDYLGYVCTNSDPSALCKIQVPITQIIKVTHGDYKGTLMAPDLVDRVKVQTKSPFPGINSKDMQQIKEFCCVGSLNSSVMLGGPYSGTPIVEARNRIIDGNQLIIPYYEPDQVAYSRSGDKLIVAKMDQWFIDYGDMKWKESAKQHVETMHFTDQTVRNGIVRAIEWLDQWPCSRTYGLGTSFPEEIVDKDTVDKDTVHKIDSLSDSTIYMALYTIYHLFDRYKIVPEELTNDIWDYIFLLKNHDNPSYDKFKPLREEFIHWYPVDLRVSAKDLINNHLTMCIFNHVIIWDQEFMERYRVLYPEKKITSFGPRSYEINGYISVQKPNAKPGLLEIEKMSKSKGNFKTLDQAIDLYTADSIRFTFASASTGTNDSYFDQDLCTRMIEKLYKEKLWISDKLTELVKDVYKERKMNFSDQMILNEMLIVCKDVLQAYKRLDFHDVVTRGFHIFQGLMDTYRDMNQSEPHGMNPTVLRIFIRAQLMMMNPIIPHFCAFFDHQQLFHTAMGTYMDSMGMNLRLCDLETLFADQGIETVDRVKHWQHKYLSDISSDIAKRVLGLNKKKPVNKVTIYTAGEITDPLEKIAHQIFQKSSRVTLEAKDIIMEGKLIDPITVENPKNVGTLIKYYRDLEEMIETYGVDLFDQMINGKISEAETLRTGLEYYLRRNVSDKYTVNIINYTANSSHGTITGVRIVDPVIRYD